MGFTSNLSFIRKNPITTAIVTIALAAGVVFTVKDTDGNPIFRCYTATGCVVSGALTVDGVLLNTGSVVTQTNADSRYVNTSGDTMTGALKVRANLSGSTLNVDGTTRMGSGIIINRTTDIGWTLVSGANTACNTTCVTGCVLGFADTAGVDTAVICTDATADKCLCAGGN